MVVVVPVKVEGVQVEVSGEGLWSWGLGRRRLLVSCCPFCGVGDCG